MATPTSAFASLSQDPAPALTRGPIPEFVSRSGAYLVRFAQSEADVDAICRLRFEVFNLEMGEGLDAAHDVGEDRDAYDAQCQHLMVEFHNEDSGVEPRVVGTYRLQTASSAEEGAGFYSASEFDLSGMPKEMLEDAIELGRACVRREHRNRRSLFLLWKGLAAYVLWHRKRYFFGCNSLTTESELEGWRMMRFLTEHGHVHSEFLADPQPGYECGLPAPSGPEDEMPLEIPPLFGIYLRYGAKVCGPPAHDSLFHTIDFLTVVDLDEMDERTFQNFASDR